MVADRCQMEVMLNHTTKPIIFVTTDLAGCVDAVEMAETNVQAFTPAKQRRVAAVELASLCTRACCSVQDGLYFAKAFF